MNFSIRASDSELHVRVLMMQCVSDNSYVIDQ